MSSKSYASYTLLHGAQKRLLLGEDFVCYTSKHNTRKLVTNSARIVALWRCFYSIFHSVLLAGLPQPLLEVKSEEGGEGQAVPVTPQRKKPKARGTKANLKAEVVAALGAQVRFKCRGKCKP